MFGKRRYAGSDYSTTPSNIITVPTIHQKQRTLPFRHQILIGLSKPISYNYQFKYLHEFVQYSNERLNGVDDLKMNNKMKPFIEKFKSEGFRYFDSSDVIDQVTNNPLLLPLIFLSPNLISDFYHHPGFSEASRDPTLETIINSGLESNRTIINFWGKVTMGQYLYLYLELKKFGNKYKYQWTPTISESDCLKFSLIIDDYSYRPFIIKIGKSLENTLTTLDSGVISTMLGNTGASESDIHNYYNQYSSPEFSKYSIKIMH